MSGKRDVSQYGNEKGISVNHYLINMIHEILVSVDNNTASEKCAVFCSLIDWKQTFDRQCLTLGVQSFANNGVRNSLIPLLIDYFQGRRMTWGRNRSEKSQWWGPPGGTLGNFRVFVPEQQ